jgi:hypothetical protein
MAFGFRHRAEGERQRVLISDWMRMRHFFSLSLA